MNTKHRMLVLLSAMSSFFLLSAGCGIDTTEVMAPRQPQVVGGGGIAVGADITWDNTIQGMLQTYCSECHASSVKTAGVNIDSRDDLISVGVVVPGDPDGSILLQVLEGGIMPPPGRPAPSADEVAAVRAWIEAGAP